MKQVLVVDDDEGMREFAAELVKRSSCAVMTQSNPAEAIAMCHLKHYDVVLTDLNMPEMSGCVFARRLRELEGSRKIILMTSEKIEDVECREDFEAGLFDVIIHKRDLFNQLRYCLEDGRN